jgi:hypothetical protein
VSLMSRTGQPPAGLWSSPRTGPARRAGRAYVINDCVQYILAGGRPPGGLRHSFSRDYPLTKNCGKKGVIAENGYKVW